MEFILGGGGYCVYGLCDYECLLPAQCRMQSRLFKP
uniref:Uncharacterized protein n=1 Tax=Anguilla anguilla TaxID=7936 RepID=A0A0E9QUN0_ANGAN